MRASTILGPSCALAVGLLVGLPTTASAVMLTFTHTGSGNGTLNGVAFPTSDFVITATGDTANRRCTSWSWEIFPAPASIWIAGLGTFGLPTSTYEFVNYENDTVGFGGSGGDLFNGPTNAAFGTWNMLQPIGPISGTGYLQGGFPTGQIYTTGGVLVFNNLSCLTTYTVTPEPATLALLALGSSVTIVRRKR